MSESFETVKNMVEMGLFNQARKTEDELRAMIRGVASAVAPDLGEPELEQIAREIESKQGIKAGLGAVVDSENFEPWLDDAKPKIEPYYWSQNGELHRPDLQGCGCRIQVDHRNCGNSQQPPKSNPGADRRRLPWSGYRQVSGNKKGRSKAYHRCRSVRPATHAG